MMEGFRSGFEKRGYSSAEFLDSDRAKRNGQVAGGLLGGLLGTGVGLAAGKALMGSGRLGAIGGLAAGALGGAYAMGRSSEAFTKDMKKGYDKLSPAEKKEADRLFEVANNGSGAEQGAAAAEFMQMTGAIK